MLYFSKNYSPSFPQFWVGYFIIQVVSVIKLREGTINSYLGQQV